MSTQMTNRKGKSPSLVSADKQVEPMPHRLRGLPRHIHEEVREWFRNERIRGRK